jgi:hypothetical protein
MFHFNLPLPAIAAGMDFKVFQIFLNAEKCITVAALAEIPNGY